MEQPTINIVLPGFGMNVHLTITDDRVRIEEVLTATGESNGSTAYSLHAFTELLTLGNPHVPKLEICEWCSRSTKRDNHVCGGCFLAGHGAYYHCDDCGNYLTTPGNLICHDCIEERVRDKESMEWLGDDSEREEA